MKCRRFLSRNTRFDKTYRAHTTRHKPVKQATHTTGCYKRIVFSYSILNLQKNLESLLLLWLRKDSKRDLADIQLTISTNNKQNASTRTLLFCTNLYSNVESKISPSFQNIPKPPPPPTKTTTKKKTKNIESPNDFRNIIIWHLKMNDELVIPYGAL